MNLVGALMLAGLAALAGTWALVGSLLDLDALLVKGRGKWTTDLVRSQGARLVFGLAGLLLLLIAIVVTLLAFFGERPAW